MASGPRSGRGNEGDTEAAVTDAYRHILEQSPVAFAVTRGRGHVLVSANATFRRLIANQEELLDSPIAEAVEVPGLLGLLDRAFNEGRALRDQPVGGSPDRSAPWSCTVWPRLADGTGSDGLVIELRAAATADPALALQRELAERMLLGALRESEAADVAGAAQHRASFLAAAGRRLAESIDEHATWQVVREMHLPHQAAWCVVDLIASDGAMRRLAIIHPDPVKQEAAMKLEAEWSPEPGDPFGAPAVLRTKEAVAITENVDEAVALASHDAKHLAVLRELGIGSLLTVPMIGHGRVLGAITFVGAARNGVYTREELRLAEDLALHSAIALDNARLYGEAVELQAKAEHANRTKSDFLGHMSHELRTPLNAIAGYTDLMDLEIHGPVTEAQRADLQRIRVNQQQLLVMINDILSFMHAGSGRLSYDIGDLPVHEVLSSALELIGPLIARKQLVNGGATCDRELIVRADPDRLQQILVNLLTNAVKFTEPGGEITIECIAAADTVLIKVKDTGVGIPADRLAAVFEPFVQVSSGLTDNQSGVGLGLAISRELAIAMHGNLTAESTPGQGSCFTLSLPCP